MAQFEICFISVWLEPFSFIRQNRFRCDSTESSPKDPMVSQDIVFDLYQNNVAYTIYYIVWGINIDISVPI